MSRQAFLLALAVAALAFALRVWALESTPPGFYIDEASVGVEAHAIATTGRDTRGTLLPAIVPAMQDWKHPLYIYATVPSVAALGPTKTAVRLPAAVFGALTVLLVALLAFELWGDMRISFGAALVLAVTPWHVHYSRAWEAITLPFAAVLALWLFFRARRIGGAGRFALAGAAFGLLLYTYVAVKLLLPALLAALAVLAWRDARWAEAISERLRKHAESLPAPPLRLAGADTLPLPRTPVTRRDFTILLLALAVVAIPMAVAQVQHFAEIQTRFNAVSVFRQPEPAAAMVKSYGAHLDPAFLFVKGDANVRHGLPGFGLLLLATSPFCALGFLRMLARRQFEDLLLVAWLAIYPLGAVLTSEGIPHATRTILATPLFALLAAQGAALCLDRVLGNFAKRAAAVIFLAALLANAGYVLHAYFTTYARISGPRWAAGVERLIPELVARRPGIKRVHFMPSPYRDVAIVREHVLFFTGFDPALDPGRPEPYFVWEQDSPGRSWPRWLMKLPKDEVLVTWVQPGGGWGVSPLMKIEDGLGGIVFEVYQGFGK